MKHDFLVQQSGDAADRFCSWLEQDTVDSLRRSRGDADATKAAVFLYVNRAYEAHMPETKIGEMFGICVVRAGYSEAEEGPAFDLLETLGQLAAQSSAR